MSDTAKLTTKQLMCIAAQSVLDHRDAGRAMDPQAVDWAEFILKANTPQRPSHASATYVRLCGMRLGESVKFPTTAEAVVARQKCSKFYGKKFQLRGDTITRTE